MGVEDVISGEASCMEVWLLLLLTCLTLLWSIASIDGNYRTRVAVAFSCRW
jgi:hypothetical protein